MTRPTVRIIAALFVVGVLYRLYPIVLGMPSLSSAFLTEDGYLMLTVARNMAIGLGMSVSEGTIVTNGIQPLVTFLFTLPYLMTGGDKVTSLIGIHLIMTAACIGAFLALRSLTARLLLEQGASAVLAWAVALMWFLGPNLLRHSMNGLETGLITLFTVLVLVQFGRVLAQGADGNLLDRLALGVLCGLAFLARIDAALLVIAVFFVWALDCLFRQRLGFFASVWRLLLPGVVTLILAGPWLLNNLLNFGSLMPISGSAQSVGAVFGNNAHLLPAKLFEHVFPMLPIPRNLEEVSVIMIVCVLGIVAVIGPFLWRVIRSGDPVIRAVVLAYALHALALILYYGLFFGAPHFLSRYLAPLAPLFLIAAVSTALDLGRWLRLKKTETPALLLSFGGLALSSALLVRLLLPGAPVQGHMQIVAWAEANVPDHVWVGAIQTGTLGYWHDRTINLDGKVNPDALNAVQTEGHVLAYAVQSDIDYVIDWVGVGAWADDPAGNFSTVFELVVEDPRVNIAVLARRIPRQPIGAD
ncbi:hypothetical protein [Jannaschia sp. CCS1]|uniref:hypothetical protein n=1 Tax=Jannaschia sp. (strain CCS1) TaxID=290400 RepID=UPI000053B3C3|nr:hypothetical protein [Jannaschia sp. CCS1]ABD57168.1 hypothetical protein Jann_4252 [Jannaschia sp. CCS1]